MNKILNQAAALSLLAALCGMAAAADPLQTPARMSARAPGAMLVGLAAAGQRSVAVGERGIILYRDASSKDWTQADVPVSVTLTAVAFSGANLGWAVGHDGVILATNDGGKHWQRQFDGKQANALMLEDAKAAVERAKAKGGTALEDAENALGDVQAGSAFGPSRPLLGVWFRDPSQGYAVGAYGQAFRTNDGGRNWTSFGPALVNPEGLHYNAVGGDPDGQLAIAGEGGRVYRSRDNGATWQLTETGYSGQLYGVVFHGRALLAYGFGGHVFRSEDGGPWRELASATRKSIVGGLLRDGCVVLAAQDGTLLASEDGVAFRVLRAGDGVPTAAMLPHNGEVQLAGMGGVRLAQKGKNQ